MVYPGKLGPSEVDILCLTGGPPSLLTGVTLERVEQEEGRKRSQSKTNWPGLKSKDFGV